MKTATIWMAAALLLAAPSLRAAADFPAGVVQGHSPVGHYYGNWASDTPDLLVQGWGDNCVVWKDVVLDAGELLGPCSLWIGCDDGAQAWVNGVQVLEASGDAHGVGFWNYGIDITPHLMVGRNRITMRVWNVCRGGSGEGGLDFEMATALGLRVPSGYFNGWSTENELWADGGDCAWSPVNDARGLEFTHRDYGWVEETVEAREIATAFTLAPAFPNPFNPTTTLEYHLEAMGEIHLAVYDLAGREVALLEQGVREAGIHRAAFDASGLPSGVYVARLEAEGRVESRKLVLMK